MKFTPIPTLRMNDSQKKFVVLVAVIGITLTQLVGNSPLQGQTVPPRDVYVPTHRISGDTGVILEGDKVVNYHNSFICGQIDGDVPMTLNQELDSTVRFWLYEYTGNEERDPQTGLMDMSTAKGKFYFSEAVLTDDPTLRDVMTLRIFDENKLYYLMSDTSMKFSCNLGFTPLSVCGDGVVDNNEECDDGNKARNDECSSSCKLPVVYIEQIDIGEGGHIPPNSDKNIALVYFRMWSENGAAYVKSMKFSTEQGTLANARSNSDLDGIQLWLDNNPDDTDNTPNVKWTTGVIQNNKYVRFAMNSSQGELVMVLNEGQVRHFAVRAPHVGVLGQETFQLQFADEEFAVATTKSRVKDINVKLQRVHSPSWTSVVCGDGRVTGDEACDDSNTANRDGCSDECRVEVGFSCTGDRSKCSFMVPSLPSGDSHFECTNQQCATVNGVGPDKCNSDRDCSGTIGGSGASGAGPSDDGDAGPGAPGPGTRPTAELSVSVPSVQPVKPSRGHAFSVTQIIANAGPDSATNLKLTASILSGALYQPLGSNEGCGLVASGDIECISPDNLVILNFTIPESAPCVESIRYTVMVEADEFDPKTANNSRTKDIAVDCDTEGGVAQLVTIRNANPDSDGSSIPVGRSSVGQFKLTNEQGRDTFALDKIIFEVAAAHVAMRTDSFKIYNKSDETKKANCTPHYATGQPFPAPSTAGIINLLVECNVEDVSVETEISDGSSITFVLEVEITNPNTNSAQTSNLQIGMNKYSNPNLGYSRNAYGNYVRWHSINAAGVHGPAIEVLQPTDGTESVLSTLYES